MLDFKAITRPFEHEAKQFVLINSVDSLRLGTAHMLASQFAMLLNRVASHLLFVRCHNGFS